MATNDFQAFGNAAGANVMSQADYLALAARVSGFSSGTANSAQLNKVWRQASVMAYVLAQCISDITRQDVLDNGAPATILANLKASLAASSPAAGSARNASMIVAAASAIATFTADEVVVKTALGGSSWVLPSFSKTINLGTIGAGGMDTGTAPANGFVAIYAIYNPTTGASALLGVNATSVKAPEVYGGANMPAGFTASALVSVVPLNASAQIKALTQFNRSIDTAYQSVLTTTTPVTTPTAVSASAVLPKNAYAATVSISASEASSGSGVQFSVSGSSGQVSIVTVQAIVSGQTSSSGAIGRILLQVPQQLYYFMLNTNATTAGIGIYGYEF